MSAVDRRHGAAKPANFDFFSLPKTKTGKVALASVSVGAFFNLVNSISNYSVLGTLFMGANFALAHYCIHKLENPSHVSLLEQGINKITNCCCCKRLCKAKKSAAPERSERTERTRGRDRDRDTHSTRHRSSSLSRLDIVDASDFESSLLDQPQASSQRDSRIARHREVYRQSSRSQPQATPSVSFEDADFDALLEQPQSRPSARPQTEARPQTRQPERKDKPKEPQAPRSTSSSSFGFGLGSTSKPKADKADKKA